MAVLKRKIPSEAYQYFIADESTNDIIARASLYIHKNDLHMQPYGYIEDVFVENSARGLGCGTQLLEKMIDESKSLGCYKIALDVKKSNIGAQKLYERMGFEKDGFSYRITF